MTETPVIVASDDADDMNEFLEAQKTAKPDSTKAKRARSYNDNDPDDDEGENTKSVLTQYAEYGSGFLPAPSSVKTLPPSVYKVIETQQGLVFLPVRVISDNIVKLPGSRSAMVVDEVDKFWKLKSKFAELGFAHKRGYLLYGPPGSGKTVTAMIICDAVVKELKGVVVIANSMPPSSIATALGQLREIESERPVVVLLEDIDSYIERYDSSEVLALLDGEMSIANVVFVATTNHPEALEPRIVNRPSRFDRVIKVGMPSKSARYTYFKSRNLPVSDEEIVSWTDKTDGFSIAHLKELVVGCLCYGTDVDSVIARLEQMRVKPTAGGENRPVGFGSSSNSDDDIDE